MALSCYAHDIHALCRCLIFIVPGFHSKVDADAVDGNELCGGGFGALNHHSACLAIHLCRALAHIIHTCGVAHTSDSDRCEERFVAGCCQHGVRHLDGIVWRKSLACLHHEGDDSAVVALDVGILHIVGDEAHRAIGQRAAMDIVVSYADRPCRCSQSPGLRASEGRIAERCMLGCCRVSRRCCESRPERG